MFVCHLKFLSFFTQAKLNQNFQTPLEIIWLLLTNITLFSNSSFKTLSHHFLDMISLQQQKLTPLKT